MTHEEAYLRLELAEVELLVIKSKIDALSAKLELVKAIYGTPQK